MYYKSHEGITVQIEVISQHSVDDAPSGVLQITPECGSLAGMLVAVFHGEFLHPGAKIFIQRSEVYPTSSNWPPVAGNTQTLSTSAQTMCSTSPGHEHVPFMTVICPSSAVQCSWPLLFLELLVFGGVFRARFAEWHTNVDFGSLTSHCTPDHSIPPHFILLHLNIGVKL